MQINFLGQPFPGSRQIGEAIRLALERDESEVAWFVTAWGKRSGLSRLGPALEAFRERGGRVEAVLGVDEGGATIEGLDLAQTLFDRVWIFHDPGARTFHPKMYLVQGAEAASLVVGSGNLTKGGLYTNYEIAVDVALDLSDEEDARLSEQARAYFQSLLESGAARPLTDDLIAELKTDPRVLLVSERRANVDRARRRDHEGGGAAVFGTTALPGLLGAPAPGVQPLADEGADDDDLLPSSDAAAASSASEEEFFKALSKNDVSLRDSPGQIIIPIGFLSFFGSLEVQMDKTAAGGPRQSHREFSATYRDGDDAVEVDSCRVILYEPAAAHKRPNSEVRFTFRNRAILEDLAVDQVLSFAKRDGHVTVERHPIGWRPPGVAEGVRYAWS